MHAPRPCEHRVIEEVLPITDRRPSGAWQRSHPRPEARLQCGSAVAAAAAARASCSPHQQLATAGSCPEPSPRAEGLT